MTTQPVRPSIRFQIVLARSVMLATAAGIFFTGYAILTNPWAVPFVIGLWLGAAAIAALGILTKLEP